MPDGPSILDAAVEDAALAVVRGSGLDTRFDELLDLMMRRLRAELGVPDVPVEDFVEEELRQTRERLAAFKAEHDQILARLLASHLGEEHLPEVLAAVLDARVRRLLDAMGRMQPELATEMRSLSNRMRQRAFEP